MAGDFALTLEELREVAAFSAASAEAVLPIFERHRSDDLRPQAAVEACWEFARGGQRTKHIRDMAWAAMRAARDVDAPATQAAAQAALSAASAPYLHPLAKGTQVIHILGAAAYAALAVELEADGDHVAGVRAIENDAARASPLVVDVLLRYPLSPEGRGRMGELQRMLDRMLRPDV